MVILYEMGTKCHCRAVTYDSMGVYVFLVEVCLVVAVEVPEIYHLDRATRETARHSPNVMQHHLRCKMAAVAVEVTFKDRTPLAEMVRMVMLL